MKATIVCLCYNHRPFVGESIASVASQTYHDIQLIVVDDGSDDGSQEEIKRCIEGDTSIKFLELDKNQGNCRAFNQALPYIEGEFVIDLSGDDVLLPLRVASGIEELTSHGLDYGVNFSDAEYISAEGHHLSYHSDKYPHSTIPQGDIYRDLVERYFICSPTMMFRTSVLRDLGGYNEALAYEDFDFWIRSSRRVKYCYTPDVLVKKRVLPKSLGKRQFSRKYKHAESTFLVCGAIDKLNRSAGERAALHRRLWYEIRSALRRGQFSLAYRYLALLRTTQTVD